MRVDFHGVRFDLPPEWADITDDLGDEPPPYTLARPSASGLFSFQCSTTFFNSIIIFIHSIHFSPFT